MRYQVRSRLKNLTKEELLKKWDFSLDITNVLIGGQSPVDLTRLYIENDEEASRFLSNYGYLYASDLHKKKIHAIFIESVNFIKEILMPKEWCKGRRPPVEFLECDDIRQILQWASPNNSYSTEIQKWSCATLKIMHTISHLDDFQHINNISKARSQIMGRFQKYIKRDAEGRLWFGDSEDVIELEKVEWKPSKHRNSMILKLLHKPANVAETIYDLVGVRIVTKNSLEALIAVRYLDKFYLVDFANIHPMRSRNTLVDHNQIYNQINTFKKMLVKNEITENTFIDMMSRLKDLQSNTETSNPHSSTKYRSIQLTCRQRVQYLSHQQRWQKKLIEYASKDSSPQKYKNYINEFISFIQNWYDSNLIREQSILFPFEVQILDKEGYMESEKGEASHERYKKAQIRTVRKRILSPILFG